MSAATPAPVPNSPIEEIGPLVARLRETFESGRTRPLAWRRSQLEALIRFAKECGDALVEALQADMGKPELEARAADIGQITQEAKLALKNLKKWTRPEGAGRVPVINSPESAHLAVAPVTGLEQLAAAGLPVQPWRVGPWDEDAQRLALDVTGRDRWNEPRAPQRGEPALQQPGVLMSLHHDELVALGILAGNVPSLFGTIGRAADVQAVPLPERVIGQATVPATLEAEVVANDARGVG